MKKIVEVLRELKGLICYLQTLQYLRGAVGNKKFLRGGPTEWAAAYAARFIISSMHHCISSQKFFYWVFSNFLIKSWSLEQLSLKPKSLEKYCVINLKKCNKCTLAKTIPQKHNEEVARKNI